VERRHRVVERPPALSIGTVMSRRSSSRLLVNGEMLLHRKPSQSHPDEVRMPNL
jgi:hypothetical protein